MVNFEFQSVDLRLFDSTIRSTVVIQKVMVVHDIIQFLDRRVSMWRHSLGHKLLYQFSIMVGVGQEGCPWISQFKSMS